MAIPLELVELIERTRNEAWADLYAAAPPDLVRELGLSVERFGSALAQVVAKLDHPMFNCVSGLGVGEAADEETVDAICRLYQKIGIKSFAVVLSPRASPPDLAARLEARGLNLAGEGAKLFRGTESPPHIHTDLRVEEIGLEHADDFADVFIEGFRLPRVLWPLERALVGRPNWHHYLAFDGERAVACGSLFVWGRAGWLGNGATIPSHRRRGAQGAIIAERVRAGARAGCEWLTTETGLDTPESPNQSFRNMVRNGFELAYAHTLLQEKVSDG